MARQHLYFILNPALGLIKIGVAGNVEERRKGLECACGVPLEVLHVVEYGAPYEKDLHDAFGRDRQLGEWFLPSNGILGLIGADIGRIERFLNVAAPETLQWLEERNAMIAARKEAKLEASRAEREEALRLKEKAERLRAKRAANLKQRRAREAAVREQHEIAERKRIEAERAAWAARNPALVASVVRANPAEEANARRARLAEMQRERNADFAGVTVQ